MDATVMQKKEAATQKIRQGSENLLAISKAISSYTGRLGQLRWAGQLAARTEVLEELSKLESFKVPHTRDRLLRAGFAAVFANAVRESCLLLKRTGVEGGEIAKLLLRLAKNNAKANPGNLEPATEAFRLAKEMAGKEGREFALRSCIQVAKAQLKFGLKKEAKKTFEEAVCEHYLGESSKELSERKLHEYGRRLFEIAKEGSITSDYTRYVAKCA